MIFTITTFFAREHYEKERFCLTILISNDFLEMNLDTVHNCISVCILDWFFSNYLKWKTRWDFNIWNLRGIKLWFYAFDWPSDIWKKLFSFWFTCQHLQACFYLALFRKSMKRPITFLNLVIWTLMISKILIIEKICICKKQTKDYFHSN